MTHVVVQVVPITNADMKMRIHQTYRMGYIKDVILPRVSTCITSMRHMRCKVMA